MIVDLDTYRYSHIHIDLSFKLTDATEHVAL